jgi:hypothetical protein
MLNIFKTRKRKKRVLLFSHRNQIRSLNRTIAIANELQDVAWLEELMEERSRFFDSLMN